MTKIRFNNYSYAYPGRNRYALSKVSLEINEGDFVCIFGKSGSGKTTLIKSLKKGILSKGNKTGEILIDGGSLDSLTAEFSARKIAYVGQNPDDCVVCDKVWHELAFALENFGEENRTMRAKVAEISLFFGIDDLFDKDVSLLSGGQKQLLCLASALVSSPDILLLDEPTSMLDPLAAAAFIENVVKINRELGVTVIITEHRLEEVIPYATKLVLMENGKVVFDKPANECAKEMYSENGEGLEFMPTPLKIAAKLRIPDSYPYSVRDGAAALALFAESHPFREKPPQKKNAPENSVLRAENVYYAYGTDLPYVIQGLSIDIKKGSFTAVVGNNGCGKSTLLALLCSDINPTRGKIVKDKNVRTMLLPQDPRLLFECESVGEQLRRAGALFADGEKRVKESVRLCEINHLLDSHPYDLSGGEIQRAAIAKLLIFEPDVMLLDEPTKGMDPFFKKKLASLIGRLCKEGKTVVAVSHDNEFCAQYADICAMLFNGGIISSAPSNDFFASNSYYTTSARRMSRRILRYAVTANEVIQAFRPDYNEDNFEGGIYSNLSGEGTPRHDVGDLRETEPVFAVTADKIYTALTICIAAPACVYFGSKLNFDRKYLLVSLLMLVLCSMPFFINFEHRKPRSGEVLLIALLSAIGVAGRAAFYMLPQFKPVVAVTVITGAALGANAGFISGALIMLVSNMLMSQGMWSPWQMFALGIIGFMSGILFCGKKYNKAAICLFGAVSAIIVYGGIMNFYTALTAQVHPNFGIVMTYIAAGLPFDTILAVSTVIFLWICSEPMIKKIRRVKMKYGV